MALLQLQESGHGTDKAIIAGLLGMEPDDTGGTPDSFSIAEKEGLQFTLGTADLKGAHPNSVVLYVKGKNGRELGKYRPVLWEAAGS